MFGFFTDPYRDELLYSAWARLYKQLNYRSARDFMQELLQSSSATPVLDLPSHLRQFRSSLPPGHRYTAEALIQNHSLLPLYAPFTKLDRLQRIESDMIDGDGKAIHLRLSLMANRIRMPQFFRYCDECV